MAWSRRSRDGFTEFAGAVAARLIRTGYFLCGDWHLAEDLAQTALAKVYAAWPKVERAGNPEAYAKRILVNTYLDRRRRRSSDEVPGIDVARLEEVPGRSGDPELRVTLLSALGQLTPRQRVVLVLRFWEDQSVQVTAEYLGMSADAVKTMSARALARLREVLGDSLDEVPTRPQAGA